MNTLTARNTDTRHYVNGYKENVSPKGYVSGDVFWTEARRRLDRQITNNAIRAVQLLQQNSISNGLDDMSLEEINREIEIARQQK